MSTRVEASFSRASSRAVERRRPKNRRYSSGAVGSTGDIALPDADAARPSVAGPTAPQGSAADILSKYSVSKADQRRQSVDETDAKRQKG